MSPRGKSGLRMVAQGLTALMKTSRNIRLYRNSGTERMSQVAMILEPGTGSFKGAKRVKTAKLCVEQDQIGKHANARLFQTLGKMRPAWVSG